MNQNNLNRRKQELKDMKRRIAEEEKRLKEATKIPDMPLEPQDKTSYPPSNPPFPPQVLQPKLPHPNFFPNTQPIKYSPPKSIQKHPLMTGQPPRPPNPQPPHPRQAPPNPSGNISKRQAAYEVLKELNSKRILGIVGVMGVFTSAMLMMFNQIFGMVGIAGFCSYMIFIVWRTMNKIKYFRYNYGI